MPAESTSNLLEGRVVRIASEPRAAAKGGYLFRGLELAGDTDNDRIFIIFPIFTGDDLYEFPLLCWEGARIAAIDLELNNRLDDGSVIYAAAAKTELLLEPYHLVSVTEAVEAASCLRIADVRYRVGPDEPIWMAKGKLIHTLFEHLVENGAEAWNRAFETAFRSALPAFMSALPGSRVVTDERALEDEARNHFENLGWWLEKNWEIFASPQVEVDRMSSRLGLKGRADALFYDGEDRLTILELKSGKVPVDAHMLQLYAYSLLFADEKPNAHVDGFVFYSSTGRAIKLDSRNSQSKSNILMGRNRAVFLKHAYTQDTGALSEHECTRNDRCFSRSACRRLFCDPEAGPGLFRNNQERDYYNYWFKLLSIDTWSADEDFARILDQETLKDRLDEGVTLRIKNLTLQENADSSGEDLTRGMNQVGNEAPRQPHSMLKGQIHAELEVDESNAEVSPGEEIILHRGNPCAEPTFRARVQTSQPGRILVSIRIPVSRSSGVEASGTASQLEPQGWFLDKAPFSRAREVERQGLFGFFANANPHVVKVVVQGETEAGADPAIDSDNKVGSAPPVDDLCFSEGLRNELNEDQEAAVRSALDSPVYHLIHGPPGTGKTRALARLIRICLDSGERILVTCPTNVALDRLLIALMNLGVKDFLRLGGHSSASGEFLEALKGIGNPPALLEDFCKAHPKFQDFSKRIAQKTLIGATAYQTAAHPFFIRQRFDRVVVDEAGQLDEPATLAPLSLAPKFVLGGDHFQLPPVVRARHTQSSSEDNSGLEVSLFERLFRTAPESRISRLKTQYRMNREIQEIPSQIFYDGALVPSPDVAGRRLNIKIKATNNDQISKIVDPDLPVVFVDVPGADSGKARVEEAEVARKIVEALLALGVPSHEVGIITPYRAQQALIRSRLSENGQKRPQLSVDTVDRFQGGEREVIIVSLARSDGVTSFLADRKRLNVSLSRARSKLILLGHGQILGKHPLFMSILEGLERIVVKISLYHDH